ncbi:MAG TPA: phosphoribosyltransferase family protein [Pseudolysinimonas sp.]|nr:phosphoribosyltransferase family protein [Pseudolysinimonas sp.]
MRASLAEALAFLFPVPCAGCGIEGRALCAVCSPRLAAHVSVTALPGVGPVTAGLAYDGVPRAVLLALKEEGRSGLAVPLAVPFAEAVAAALGPGPDAVVAAVPSSRAARRRRGFEPVRLLASRAGIQLAPLFLSAEPHAAQKGLGVAERARNLDGVFALARAVSGLRVLLIDDVVTTGATLAAAAAVLHAGGAEVAGAAVLAATPRRSVRSPGTLSNST